MSNPRESKMKNKGNDHPLKYLPTDVLLKARSTLGTLLKSRHHEHQRPKPSTQVPKDRSSMKDERLKSSRSEPEFSEVVKKRRSRIDECSGQQAGLRPRPLSVGAHKRTHYVEKETDLFSQTPEASLLNRRFDSAEEVCVQSRLVLPVHNGRLNSSEPSPDAGDKPRKKLSFREPEIIESATLGRSYKLMGVNSLARNRFSLPPEHISSAEGLDLDLESQAMRIVRTVGQAFDVCHKMQADAAAEPAASTSSVLDEPPLSASASASDRNTHLYKDAASEFEDLESVAVRSRVAVEVAGQAGGVEPALARPTSLGLLPPPPKKDGRRSPKPAVPPCLDLPECLSKLVVSPCQVEDASTPLSAQHQLQLLRERLEQQSQQTRAAVAQLLLLRDQLAAEQSARCEAQARTHQLLVHNKELLEHIAALVAHLQVRERGSAPAQGIARPISAHQLTLVPQLSSSAKIDRWFSLLPGQGDVPALSRPESGFVSGVEDSDAAATLAEARHLLLQLSAKKKRRIIPLRFRRKLLNKHKLL